MTSVIRVGMMLAAALACLASAQHRKYVPETATAPPGVTDADLWAAAVRVLTDEGFVLSDKDESAGIVRTDWIGGAGGTRNVKTFYAYRAVAAEGELRMFLDCRMNTVDPITGAEDVEECGDSRPENLLERLPRLKAAILTEAERRAAKRRAGEPAAPAPPPQPAAASPPTDAGAPLDGAAQ